MGGRIISGIVQILIAVAGFALIILWFILMLMGIYDSIANGAPEKSYGYIGLAGAFLFALAWCWALATSMSLLRQAKSAESNPARNDLAM